MDTTPTPLGNPIVVHDSIVVCDQSDTHEFRVITDGYRAYAYAVGHGMSFDTTEFWRDGSTISAVCPCLSARTCDDEPCDGRITTDLTTAHWTADAEAITLLVAFSGKVDQP